MKGYVDLFAEAYGMYATTFLQLEMRKGRNYEEVQEQIDRMVDEAWRAKKARRAAETGDGFLDVNMDDLPEEFKD